MARYDGKSERYSGVYWKMVKRLDGRGTERLYYVIYKRSGERKNNEEKIGRSSEGWNEAKAHLERGKRISGKPTNTERRENEQKLELAGDGPLNVDRIWAIYLAAHEANKSIKDDRNRYQKHISPNLGMVGATELATRHIVALRTALEKYGLSPQSVKHCLALVKRIIRYAVRVAIIPQPASLVFDMPAFDNRVTETMTAEQYKAYWQALDEEADQDMAALLRVAMLTGIRRGALFNLQWSDCDFEHGIITLQGKHAKNGKTALIPMIDAVKEILQGIRRTDSPYIFPGRNGERRATFCKMPRRIREKAGLPKDFRPIHALRHVFASNLANSGKVTLYMIQQLLTHSNPALTQRYAHPAEGALRKAAAVASETIPQSSSVDKVAD